MFSKTNTGATRSGGMALVAGATSGIGRAFARQLAASGLHLILVARRRAVLDEFARELRLAYGIRCFIIEADLTSAAAAHELYEQIVWEGWQVDLLVNSAGVARFVDFSSPETVADQDTVMLNIRVPLELMHCLVPAMRARGHGGVICVGSLLADQRAPYRASYDASRGFMATLAHSVRKEFCGSGVDLLLIVPGLTCAGTLANREIAQELPFHESSPEGVASLALHSLGQCEKVSQRWLRSISKLSSRLMVLCNRKKIDRLSLSLSQAKKTDIFGRCV